MNIKTEIMKVEGKVDGEININDLLHIIYKDDSGSFYGIADQRREGAAYGL